MEISQWMVYLERYSKEKKIVHGYDTTQVTSQEHHIFFLLMQNWYNKTINNA